MFILLSHLEILGKGTRPSVRERRVGTRSSSISGLLQSGGKCSVFLFYIDRSLCLKPSANNDDDDDNVCNNRSKLIL
jgi:hypothetical protein